MRYRDQTGDDWADIIDMLTMHPEERRKVVGLLADRSDLQLYGWPQSFIYKVSQLASMSCGC